MAKLGSPFLHRISSLEEKFDRSRYPFNIPAFGDGIDIALDSKVTMLVGENGSGKILKGGIAIIIESHLKTDPL